jgi:hypothetical protein
LKSGILSQLLLASVMYRQKSSVYEVFFAAFEQEELLFPFPMPVLNCSGVIPSPTRSLERKELPFLFPMPVLGFFLPMPVLGFFLLPIFSAFNPY